MSQKPKKTRVLFPIGSKLVIIISILLLVSLGAVIVMVSALGSEDVQLKAEENNFAINTRAGSQAEGSIISVRDAVLFYLEMVDRLPSFGREQELEWFFFNRNLNIASIGVTRNDHTVYIHNTQFLNSNGINNNIVEVYFDTVHSAVPNTTLLFNASPVFQVSMLTAVFTHEGNTGEETVKVLFSPDDLHESFGTGTNTSFIINSAGDLLIHPDIFLVLGGVNFSSMELVEKMKEEGDNNRQVPYDDEDGEKYFGAYYRITGIDATVITIISENSVFESIRNLTRQNLYLAGTVLFIAICFIWFFSKTISGPARALAAAALKIEEGDFEINLKPQTRDELGLLTESFNRMSSALNIFGRFTNKHIAIRAMRGEIKPGGIPKHATIFFSDIRNFTKISENFTKNFGNDASNRIVLWLNEYFNRMIDCVEKNDGIVDKFIGDAVMAHWGTVYTVGSPAADAFNCVKSALMMRDALMELNAHRKKDDPNNPVINIGCGINTGVVTAGQIGSDQRMNYTAIGDPVNLASRVEALNKHFGTDILITEDTWKLTGDKFITEEMTPVEVKGKEKPVRLFAVVNFKNTEGPKTLAHVREILGIDINNLVPQEEENNLFFERQSINDRRRGSERSSMYNSGYRSVNSAADTCPLIKMTSFGSSALVQGPAGKLVPVYFAWNISNSNQDISVIVEVASDQDFNSIVEERELIGSLSVSIPLEAGKYWWRVFPANIGSRQPINEMYPSGDLIVDSYAKEKFKIKHY